MTVAKMLDLSTAHCPVKVFDAAPLRWQAHEHGWIVWVQPEATPPAWLTPAHDNAVAKDCILIQFDADAEVDASLPTFTDAGEGLPLLSVDDLVTLLTPNGGEDDEGNDRRIKPGTTGQVLSVFWGPTGWYYGVGFPHKVRRARRGHRGRRALFFDENEIIRCEGPTQEGGVTCLK